MGWDRNHYKNEERGAWLRRAMSLMTGIPEEQLYPKFDLRDVWYTRRMFLKPGKRGIMLIDHPDKPSAYDGLVMTPVAMGAAYYLADYPQEFRDAVNALALANARELLTSKGERIV